MSETSGFFGLDSFYDLFLKCDVEKSHLEDSDVRKWSHTLFNIVVTLDHLYEWFLGDDRVVAEVRKKGLLQFNPYKRRKQVPWYLKCYYKGVVPFPAPNGNQYLVRSLANRAKHFLTDPPIDRSEFTTYPIVAGSAEAYCGGLKAFANYHEIITKFIVVDDNGSPQDIKVVCRELLSSWRKFFFIEGLPQALAR
jgi:hypothetical protein